MKPIAIFVLYIEIYVGLRVVAETKCGNAKCSSVSLQQQGKSLGKFYNVLFFLRKYALRLHRSTYKALIRWLSRLDVIRKKVCIYYKIFDVHTQELW